MTRCAPPTTATRHSAASSSAHPRSRSRRARTAFRPRRHSRSLTPPAPSPPAAAAALRSELQGYKILVAGEGDADYVAEMKRMIADNGLQDIVQLVGGVYGDEKWRLFQTSDFFVLPTHSENFGLAIAESLASGTPVITSVGTPWNDLNDTNSGAWIEIGTQPLVETLRRFLALSDAELETMGRNGRRLIEEKYSAHVMAKEMMKVYETLIPNLTNGY